MNKKQKISFCSILIVTIIICVSLLCCRNTKKEDLPVIAQALSLYQDGNFEKAKLYFEQADKEGVSEASFALGALYFSGKGVKADINKALFYYHKAAQANYAPAQTTLALMYMNGSEIEQDTETALFFAEKATENGDKEAPIILASWFENGQYVPKDLQKAVRFYEIAAKKGNINAKMALSAIYKDGKGSVLPNIFTAKRWEDSIQKQTRFDKIFQNRLPDPKTK